MSEKKPTEVKLQIQLDDDVAQGAYSNLAVINHTDGEFIVDFLFVQPQTTRAKVRSRVILSPGHFKRLIRAMEDNLGRYEKQHGSVNPGPPPAADTEGHYH